MSWAAFSNLMLGISNWCFQTYGELQKRERLQAMQQPQQSASCGDFERFIQDAARRLKAKAHWRGDAIELLVPMEGDEHTVAVMYRGGQVQVAVPSGTTFPAGGVPRDVMICLRDRNSKLDFASWDLVEADRPFFILKTGGRLYDMEPTSFAYVIQRMLIESIALDRSLVEVGFA